MVLPDWNIFGSATSTDCDIFVLVNKTTKPNESQLICVQYEKDLKEIIKTDKPLNVNLGIVENGTIVWTYKGTPDETNNSIYDTYHLHSNLQQHPPIILKRVERNLEKKMIRCIRIILGMITRTDRRVDTKKALQVNMVGYRIACLRTVHFEKIIFEGKQADTQENIWKTIAFQIGQTSALMDGIELYSKESIAEKYSTLRIFLIRQPVDVDQLAILTQELKKLLDKYDEYIKNHPMFRETKEILNG